MTMIWFQMHFFFRQKYVMFNVYPDSWLKLHVKCYLEIDHGVSAESIHTAEHDIALEVLGIQHRQWQSIAVASQRR